MADLQRLQTNRECLQATDDSEGLQTADDVRASNPALPEVATPKEAAKYVKTTEQALAQDRYLGRGLPYVRYGGRIRYLRQDVLDYLAANRVTPAPQCD
jgi:hypothetical protein